MTQFQCWPNLVTEEWVGLTFKGSSDLMTEAPSPVADKQLEELGINVVVEDGSNEG